MTIRALAPLAALLVVLGAVSATTYYCPITGRYFDDSTAPGKHCSHFRDENHDGYCDNLRVVSESTNGSSTSSSNTSGQSSSTTGTSTAGTPVGLVAVIAGLAIAAVLLRRF
ncbi:hypothetical protein [Methanopyrus sp.]